MKNKELKNKIIQSCNDHHIWLNAFNCINPTPELAQGIGFAILRKLEENDNLLPSYCLSMKDGDDISELQELSKSLFVSINKS